MKVPRDYKRIEYSSVSEKGKEKKHLLIIKDGERGWGQCFFCNKTFDEDQLTTIEKVPAALGGEHYPDNVFLSCKDCAKVKQGADRLIIKAFRDIGLVSGKKYWCWNNTNIHRLHKLYFNTLQVWAEIKEDDQKDLIRKSSTSKYNYEIKDELIKRDEV